MCCPGYKSKIVASFKNANFILYVLVANSSFETNFTGVYSETFPKRDSYLGKFSGFTDSGFKAVNFLSYLGKLMGLKLKFFTKKFTKLGVK